MRSIKLTNTDIKDLVTALKKIIGQLQSISSIIEDGKTSDQTFTQLLAAKGGITRVCKEIISRGVMSQLDKYSPEELDQALDIIFKL